MGAIAAVSSHRHDDTAIGGIRRPQRAVEQARHAFALSLAAVIVQFGYTFTVLRAIELLGPAAAVPFPLVVTLIGGVLLWLAIQARSRGWLAG
jgi:hypothetical protein